MINGVFGMLFVFSHQVSNDNELLDRLQQAKGQKMEERLADPRLVTDSAADVALLRPMDGDARLAAEAGGSFAARMHCWGRNV